MRNEDNILLELSYEKPVCMPAGEYDISLIINGEELLYHHKSDKEQIAKGLYVVEG